MPHATPPERSTAMTSRSADTAVTKWVDHVAVKALQDQADAALKINEPFERLVALTHAHTAFKTTLDHATGVPLSAEGQEALKANVAKQKKILEGFALAGLCGLIASPVLITCAAALAAAPLIVPVLGGAMVGGMGLVWYYDALFARLRQLPQPITEAAATLAATGAQLAAAIRDLEATLTLDEARQSGQLEAALETSPRLMERFTAEAARREAITLIKGNAKPATAAVPIPKPLRRDIAV